MLLIAPRYNPVSPSTTISSWDHNHSSPGSASLLHCPPSYPPTLQELPRSVSVGRNSNTPKGHGPGSVGLVFSATSDYGSPASMPATVPVSPNAKSSSFQNSIPSCPQKSPTPSISTDSRTPVPQLQSVHSASGTSNGSLPSTPRTPGKYSSQIESFLQWGN